MSSLFYHNPALTANEALLSGNGRLGCLVFGGAPSERLVLNEETLWSGKKRNRINPACRAHLGAVRKLVERIAPPVQGIQALIDPISCHFGVIAKT